MTQYTVTAFNYVGGPDVVGDSFDVTITDDDDTTDWMGQDTGTGETIEIGGTTYALQGTGVKLISFTTADGEEVEEEFIYSIIPEYGHILIPLDEDSQFSADCEISHNSGWLDQAVEYNDIPCFTSGSLIDTPNGPRLVESLKVGDMITTMDNGPQKVLWVGDSPVEYSAQILHPKLRPVVIPAGALGPNEPTRNIAISSPHRILIKNRHLMLHHGVEQAFAPANTLLGLNGIHRDMPRQNLSYHHILLPKHEVICANGLLSESFFPGATPLHNMGPAARKSLFSAFPKLAADPTSYGATARMCLNKSESRALQIAAQHAIA